MIDWTVAHLNVEHYRKLLQTELDDAKRQTILGLLAEEEQKVMQLKNGGGEEGNQPDPRLRG